MPEINHDPNGWKPNVCFDSKQPFSKTEKTKRKNYTFFKV